MQKTPVKSGPRANKDIRCASVRLIDKNGEQIGVVTIKEALEYAANANLDLVEISPNANPPVCKILDLGKYRYELQKKAAEAKKNQKIIEIKEIKFRPTTDDNDFNIKMRAITKFLNEENKVKITLRFRGRELAHQEIGREVLNRVIARIEGLAVVESKGAFEGRQLSMMLRPLTSTEKDEFIAKQKKDAEDAELTVTV